jgi:hypothetical protein
MILEVDRQTFDRLLGPRPKIIFASIDAEAAQSLAEDDPSPCMEVDFLIFHPPAAASPARLHALAGVNGQYDPLPAPPGGPCILAALTAEARGDLTDLAAWWFGGRRDTESSILDLSDRGLHRDEDIASVRAAIDRRLLAAICKDLRSADERVAHLNSQLYELRLEYGQARDVLGRLQSYLLNLQPAFHLIETQQPSGLAYPQGDASPGRVTQPLPMSAAGLAAIDLFSPSSPREPLGDGRLLVALNAKETDSPLANWSIPYDRLGRGWFRCLLPVASASPIHHLDLVITWQTVRGRPPSLALSSVGAFPEVWATDESSPLGGALAYTAWGSLPGAVIRAPVRDCACVSAGTPLPLSMEQSLRSQDFQRIRPTAVAPFQYTHPLGEALGFRLHPLQHTLASAALPRACMAGTDRLLATVQIRNERAQYSVEYAMCLTDADAKCDAFPAAPESDRRVIGFSGWQTVPADNQSHLVVLELDRPLAAPADLHFATRMKEQRPIDDHWADWLDLRIRVRYGAVTGYESPGTEPGSEDLPPPAGASGTGWGILEAAAPLPTGKQIGV